MLKCSAMRTNPQARRPREGRRMKTTRWDSKGRQRTVRIVRCAEKN
jgi:hypothetical protein